MTAYIIKEKRYGHFFYGWDDDGFPEFTSILLNAYFIPEGNIDNMLNHYRFKHMDIEPIKLEITEVNDD